MSEAERAPNGGRQGSLKQSEGHWRENIRDRWAELMLEDAEYDDLSAELIDIVDELQKHDPEMTVTDTQAQRSYLRFVRKIHNSWSLRKLLHLPQRKEEILLRHLPANRSKTAHPGRYTRRSVVSIYGTGLRLQSFPNVG